MRNSYKSVENYTDAFLIIVGLMLFMAFFTLAATKGFVWVLLSAALIDGLIRLRLARRSATCTG
jgi:hypothetical protein